MIETKLNIKALPTELVNSVSANTQNINDINDKLNEVEDKIENDITTLITTNVNDINEQINILKGDGEGSIQEKIDKSLADAASITLETLETMLEISEWLNDEENGGAQLTQQVNENTNNINEIIDEQENIKNTVDNNQKDLIIGNVVVGQAREIHSRNGKTVTDSFLVRTTAGSGTIGDGVATLKSVGGNIVKNLVDGTFGSGWEAPFANTSFVVTNGLATFLSEADDGMGRFRYKTPTGISGHIYYQKAFIKCSIAPNDKEVRLGVMNSAAVVYGPAVIYAKPTTEWQFLSVRYKTPSSSNYGEVNIYDTRKENQGKINAYKYLYIDLTEMFGASNEPDKDTCDRLFSTMDALPQGLSIANPTSFKSVGYNQFNQANVLKGKSIDENGAIIDNVGTDIAIVECLPCKIGTGENNGYCIHGDFDLGTEKVYLTPLNPMTTEGELYMHELTKDATTDTYVPQIKGYMLVIVPNTHNLCIHFLWGEDRDKHDYEPYHESKIELPVIPQMSEYGLAGVLSYNDEIDFNRGVYVKRIEKKVLNGSENWIKRANNNGFYNDFLLSNPAITAKAITNINFIQTLNVTQYGTMVLDNKAVYISYSESVNSLSAEGFKEYLAANPIVAYYALRTPEEYPLPKFDNNYISSDYGVEQFDSVVPCNANNLYYMRSLVGETRNFLDRMYDNTNKESANEVADYITTNIAENKAKAEEAPNLALRALYIAAGAEYNDTSSHIVKDTPWKNYVDSTDYKAEWDLDVVTGSVQSITYGGKTYEYVDDNGTWKIIARVGDKLIWDDTKVIHRVGYYYLNGLGDITESQMMDTYSAGRFIASEYGQYASNKKIRTVFNVSINGQEGYNSFAMGGRFAGCSNIENAYFSTSTSLINQYGVALASNGYNIFSGCNKLRYIHKLSLSSVSSLQNTFNKCDNLISVFLHKNKKNVNLSASKFINKCSILYSINTAEPTTAITITLHPDAYVRLADDADIVAALNEKNGYTDEEGNVIAGTLPSGASINLVSA